MVDPYWIIIISVVRVRVLDEEKKDARAKKTRRTKSIPHASIKPLRMIGANGAHSLYTAAAPSAAFTAAACLFATSRSVAAVALV
jgi:hypothetical protein